MNIIEILMIGVGLASDAVAIAICEGINTPQSRFKNGLLVGGCFGLFQAIMPLFGYGVGYKLRRLVLAIDHYIVFGLLVFIGANMIYEALCTKEKDKHKELSLKTLLIPALATSIDAFSVGITFAFLHVNLVWAVSIIGIITFILSFIGYYIGSRLGRKSEAKMKILGGILLIFMGIKVLIQYFI